MAVKNNNVAPVAAPAPKAPVAKSAKPGTKDAAAGKKEKKVRVDYPGLFSGEGENQEAVKLNAIPTDFDRRRHKPLKKSDFAEEYMYLEFKAAQLETLAAKLRKEAETVKELGSAADRKSAKKLLQMQERMADLMESLRQQGINPDAILAAAKSKTEAPAAEEAAAE